MGFPGLDRTWRRFGRLAAVATHIGVSTLVVATATSANAQLCGPAPACTEPACARGRAFGTAVLLGGTDIGPLRTADTGGPPGSVPCQATAPDDDFFDVSKSGTAIPAAPLANVISSDSRTRGSVLRERFVNSQAGDAIVEVLPSAVPGAPSVLDVVSSGSQVTVCADSAIGTSHIDALIISGTVVPIPGTVAPNTTILNATLPLLILNEQVCADGSHPSGGCAACPTLADGPGCATLSCTVNALHAQVPSGGALLNVFVSSSFAEVTTCTGVPEAPIADFSAAYGGKPGESALLPWFIVGPDALDVQRNTLVAITHPDQSASGPSEFIHTELFDIHSVEACDFCTQITPQDVHVDNIYDKIKNICAKGGRDLLDAGNGKIGDNIFVGYARFELSTRDDCQTRDTEKDLVPHFYQVQLQQGLASGFNGPVYSLPGFEEYDLRRNDPLYFRILVGLGDPAGPNDTANTDVIVWSDTSGSCMNAAGDVVPDARCLRGTGREGRLIICDEEENCSETTGPVLCDGEPKGTCAQDLRNGPVLGHEVNIFSADALVPSGFKTGGGWFALLAKPSVRGSALHVLGYADNRRNANGQSAKNFQAIFPAQRTRASECPFPVPSP